MLPDNLTWFHVQIQHYLQLHLPPFHSLNLHSSFKNYMFLHEFIASLLTSLSVLVTINVTELPQHPFSQPHSLPFTPSTHTFTLQKAITQHLDQRPSPPWNLFSIPWGGGGLPCFCFVLFLTCKGLCILVVELILIQPVLQTVIRSAVSQDYALPSETDYFPNYNSFV